MSCCMQYLLVHGNYGNYAYRVLDLKMHNLLLVHTRTISFTVVLRLESW